jgi:hypothetical protein
MRTLASRLHYREWRALAPGGERSHKPIQSVKHNGEVLLALDTDPISLLQYNGPMGVESPPATRLTSHRKTKILACAVIAEELRSRLPAGIESETLDFGLHRSPERLRAQLQESIDRSSGYENVVLGYGLCGMSVIGLRSHSARLILPRADDCISVFLGSRKAYLKQQNDHPGTLFLSKGWIEGRIDDVSPSITMYQTLLKKYGEERAKRMLAVYEARQPLRHYRRLAFITTSSECNLDHYRNTARRRAADLGLDYDEVPGSTAFIDKIAVGDWDEEFVVVEPGKRLGVEHFWPEDAAQPASPQSFPSTGRLAATSPR